MKPFFLLIFFAFLMQEFICAQGVLYFDLTIQNVDGTSLSKTPFWLIETQTHDSIGQVSDLNGNVKFEVTHGNQWSLNFMEIREHTIVTVPASGASRRSMTITYVPDSKNLLKKLSDRTGIEFEEINQTIPASRLPEDNTGVLRLKYYTNIHEPVRGVSVSLVSISEKKKINTKTDNSGEARFLVAMGKNYEIDVDGIEGYDYIEIPEGRGMMIGFEKTYQPTEIKETVSNDTIRQNLTGISGPTSSREHITIILRNLDGDYLDNEPVYLDLLGTNTVYTANTDKYGKAVFLVPHGKKYELNFKYERGVKLLDNEKTQGMVTTTGEFFYRGSKAIEEYYQTSQRDKNGFLTEFMNVDVKPHQIAYNYLEQTKNGYNLNFDNESPTSTPLIQGSNLIIGEGFYSRGLNCFDLNTGSFKWGVELAESGISSVVYDDSVIFVNTYSCTLYAILASTGELLWSKWLGPSIYSTPTVANGKVYTVYPNDLEYDLIGDKQFVAVCFNLRSGKIEWQGWVDSDVIAAPVVCNNSVYLSCYSGKLYQFDKMNGNLKNTISEGVLSSPMVVKNKLYVPVLSKSKQGYQEIAVYDAENLKSLKRFSDLNGKIAKRELKGMSAAERMNFNGCQMVHYKGYNYNLMGNKLVCSDAEKGSIVWSAYMKSPTNEDEYPASMPIVVNDKLVIATNDGFVKIYDYLSGKVISEYATGNPLWLQPAIYNGIIYAGSLNGKLISIKTGDKSLTGWTMWGKTGTHNTAVE